MKITKYLEVSTGHRLPIQNDICSNLHGHTYKLMINIEFYRQEDEYIDMGSFIDWQIIEKLLNKDFGHRYLISKHDPIIKQIKDLPGIRIVDYFPTSENISKEMIDLISQEILLEVRKKDIGHMSVRLKLSETSNTSIDMQRDFKINKRIHNTYVRQ